jgi:ethanolamine transporter EutH
MFQMHLHMACRAVAVSMVASAGNKLERQAASSSQALLKAVLLGSIVGALLAFGHLWMERRRQYLNELWDTQLGPYGLL